jgi:hypothetical protein
MTLVTDKGIFNAGDSSFLNTKDIKTYEDKTISISSN